MQKFIWDPGDRHIVESWINEQVDSSDILVPIASAATGLTYRAQKGHRHYEYLGLDRGTHRR